VSVYTSGSLVSSEEDRVLSFLILHEINGCDPVLTMPCGRNVSLWVGGLDVKADFVPKIDIVGLIRIALLGGREPLFLKII